MCLSSTVGSISGFVGQSNYDFKGLNICILIKPDAMESYCLATDCTQLVYLFLINMTTRVTITLLCVSHCGPSQASSGDSALLIASIR